QLDGAPGGAVLAPRSVMLSPLQPGCPGATGAAPNGFGGGQGGAGGAAVQLVSLVSITVNALITAGGGPASDGALVSGNVGGGGAGLIRFHGNATFTPASVQPPPLP